MEGVSVPYMYKALALCILPYQQVTSRFEILLHAASPKHSALNSATPRCVPLRSPSSSDQSPYQGLSPN